MSELFLGALESYLSIRSSQTGRQYRAITREWQAFLLEKDLLSAAESDVWRFIAAQKKRHGQRSRIDGSTILTWGTIQRKLVILKTIYRHMVASKLLELNPLQSEQFTRRVNETPKRPTEALEFNEVMDFINLPGKRTPKEIRDTAILTVFFAGGLRRSEVCGLKMRNVLLTKNGTLFLRLEKTKSQKTQDQAIPEWAFKNIFDYVEQRKKELAKSPDPLFTMYEVARGPTHTHISDKSMERIWNKYRDMAKLPASITTHSARATAITKLLSDGMSYREAQEFSRHASVAMVEQYDKRIFGVDKSPAKKLAFP